MARRAVALAALAALLGCDHKIVQHAAPLTVADAGGLPDATEGHGATCQAAPDGEPCDDFDVCSPSSMCQDGVCVGGSAFDTCVVAETLEEFGDEQGELGWYYGYWNSSADADGSYQYDADFMELEFCGEGWQPPGRCGIPRDAPDYTWTMVLDWALSHPETRPDVELPIRRWVSDVSGPAVVSLEHWLSGTGGDGTRALLVIDGVEYWRNDQPGGDRESTRARLEIELRVGTVVDQIVHPIGSSADDMTHFSMVIAGP